MLMTPRHDYLHCASTAAMGAARTMHQAMGALADWVSLNRLRLNARKTKFIWLGTRQQLAKINLDALSTEFPTMSFSQVVRDLGVVLDPELTFSHHIDQVCRSCYYQLRQLRVIARSLTFNAVSPVHAFVFSRLDYCSSIFVGHPGVRMEKSRGATGLRLDLLAGSGSLITYPTIYGMCCTGFHSHSASPTGSRPWCGGACLATVSARALPPSLLMCSPSYTPVLSSR